MTHTPSPPSVVVGIDGSDAAIHAAQWAVDEALSRDIPLRLLHVIDAASEDIGLEVEFAEAASRAANAAVEATGKPVRVDSAVIRGPVEATLVDESRAAELLCVGSVGIGQFARRLLGSTAASVARSARCPVAIIFARNGAPPSGAAWIAVAVDDSPDNDTVLGTAMTEARLRAAPVLALLVERPGRGEKHYHQVDQRLAGWIRRYPDVRVRPVDTRHRIAQFLADNSEPVQLAVVGSADGDHITRFIGPVSHAVLDHADCSVLVVRH